MLMLLTFVVSFALITLTTWGLLAMVAGLYSSRPGAAARMPHDGSESTLVIPRLADPPAPTHGAGLFQRMNHWLERALYESGWSIDGESAFWLELSAGLLVGGAIVLWTDDPLLAGIGAVLGMFAVVVAILVARARRKKKIREQLPEAIEFIARAVRSGESVDRALQLVGDTIPNPLGVEFRRCARQLRYGLSIEAAVRALARRVPLTEVQIFASTLIVQRQAGGALPITLERLARVIRDRLSYYRQFRAATAGSRLSTIIIGSAGPLIVIYMMNFQEAYFSHFFETVPGQVLLVIAAVLYVTGLLVVFRLMNQDY